MQFYILKRLGLRSLDIRCTRLVSAQYTPLRFRFIYLIIFFQYEIQYDAY